MVICSMHWGPVPNGEFCVFGVLFLQCSYISKYLTLTKMDKKLNKTKIKLVAKTTSYVLALTIKNKYLSIVPTE